MSQTQTISLEKDFILALKELNTIEQDQIKIYSALFTNSCKNLKDKKMNSLSENIYGQIKFYGKNPNKYTKKINNIMSEYSNLMEQILNLYITKFITIINELLSCGAKVKAFDPKAFDSARFHFQDKITYCKNQYEALEGADCMLLLTEWNEFRRPDFEKMKSLLIQPIIFDGRNQYDAKKLRAKGFKYYQIGNNVV